MLDLDASLYQSWEWGELRRAEGWTPLRVAVEEDGAIRVGIQILERRLPGLPYRIMYAPWCVSFASQPTACVAELVGWLRTMLRKRHVVFLRLDPRFPDEDAQSRSVLTDFGFRHPGEQWSLWNLPRAVMLADLSGTEGEVRGRMRETSRRHSRAIEKSKLTLVTGDQLEHVRQLHDLLSKTAARQGFHVRGVEHYEQAIQWLAAGGRGRVFLAYLNGVAIGGIMCVQFGSVCYFFHGGFDIRYRQLGPNEALHWEAMRWAKSQGCRVYNLLGAGTRYPVQESPSGLYHFKLGLGARLHYLAGYFDLVANRPAYHVFRLAERYVLPRLSYSWMSNVRLASTFRRLIHMGSSPLAPKSGSPQPET